MGARHDNYYFDYWMAPQLDGARTGLARQQVRPRRGRSAACGAWRGRGGAACGPAGCECRPGPTPRPPPPPPPERPVRGRPCPPWGCVPAREQGKRVDLQRARSMRAETRMRLKPKWRDTPAAGGRACRRHCISCSSGCTCGLCCWREAARGCEGCGGLCRQAGSWRRRQSESPLFLCPQHHAAPAAVWSGRCKMNGQRAARWLVSTQQGVHASPRGAWQLCTYGRGWAAVR